MPWGIWTDRYTPFWGAPSRTCLAYFVIGVIGGRPCSYKVEHSLWGQGHSLRAWSWGSVLRPSFQTQMGIQGTLPGPFSIQFKVLNFCQLLLQVFVQGWKLLWSRWCLALCLLLGLLGLALIGLWTFSAVGLDGLLTWLVLVVGFPSLVLFCMWVMVFGAW